MSSEREILQRLIAGPVSGDALAHEAGLTRAAMWKRVQALREAGVEIDAQAGRGYALRSPVELLQADAIVDQLPAPIRAGIAAQCPLPCRKRPPDRTPPAVQAL